jgi:hypothetical protein
MTGLTQSRIGCRYSLRQSGTFLLTVFRFARSKSAQSEKQKKGEVPERSPQAKNQSEAGTA